jgi:hypothetical protein
MQADDFFKAYEVLEVNYNSATLAVMGPSIVCLAFSIELYIKDIYDAIKAEPIRSHSILKLFENLPENIQVEIFSHGEIGTQNPWVVFGSPFAPKCSRNNIGITDLFIYEINAISDAFTEWRYSHEGKRAMLHYNTGFALSFIKAIKSVCDKKRLSTLVNHYPSRD